jgi:hypothetical protein
MKQEDKDLLFKDLCGRLPYGVKAYVKNLSKLDRKYYEGVYTVESIYPSLNTILAYSGRSSVEVIVGYDDYEIKPYLLPLSSMTDEMWDKEFRGCNITEFTRDSFQYGCETLEFNNGNPVLSNMVKFINQLIKNHFDIYGLIPMGLAIDATGLNIY